MVKQIRKVMAVATAGWLLASGMAVAQGMAGPVYKPATPPPQILNNIGIDLKALQATGNLLWAFLRANCPPHLAVSTALGVAVGANNSCEPDVMVHRAEVGLDRHYLMPGDVTIVVEIVSPSTRRRDRFDKPFVYADAGIPYFWRIEQNPVHVYAYRLDNGIYKQQAQSADELVLDEPFPIRLPISAITP